MRIGTGLLALLLLLGIGSCREAKRYHDERPQQKIWATNALKEIDSFQQKLNADFQDPETSPLPDRYRKDFDGLDFFLPDTNFRVWAQLEYTPDAVPFMMPTTTDRTSEEVVFAIAHFSLQGKKFELQLYQNQELLADPEHDDYLFLPFLDKTNGEETYEGGRYIDLSIPDGDSILIDFNKAYNPYCVYNKKYSCPIVPKVNSLSIPVRAGMKAFRPRK